MFSLPPLIQYFFLAAIEGIAIKGLATQEALPSGPRAEERGRPSHLPAPGETPATRPPGAAGGRWAKNKWQGLCGQRMHGSSKCENYVATECTVRAHWKGGGGAGALSAS